MSLNQYASTRRLAIFEDLSLGREPREGEFDAGILKEGRTKGAPQMGTTRFTPDQIIFEFIYPRSGEIATILAVTLKAPERIVFMPVPAWVVENIWQGDVDGTHQFESDARALLDDFAADMEPGPNQKWFGPRMPKRRE